MSQLLQLEREIKGFLAHKKLNLWWRDDDCKKSSKELDVLLQRVRRFNLPVCLAVIPDGLSTDLTTTLSPYGELVCCLQHGFNHQSQALPRQRKTELAEHCPMEGLIRQLIEGREKLTKYLSQQFLPVLVPPWNRMREDLVEYLPAAGFIGVSALGIEYKEEQIRRHNVHMDLINWKLSKAYNFDELIDSFILLLKKARRNSNQELTLGVMSHHLVMAAQAWKTFDMFIECLFQFKRISWLTGRQLFQENPH